MDKIEIPNLSLFFEGSSRKRQRPLTIFELINFSIINKDHGKRQKRTKKTVKSGRNWFFQLMNWVLMLMFAGSSRDLWHGEEHWAGQEVHCRQGGTHAGGPDPPGHQDTQAQRGGMQRPRTAQVSQSASNCFILVHTGSHCHCISPNIHVVKRVKSFSLYLANFAIYVASKYRERVWMKRNNQNTCIPPKWS